MMPCPEIIYRVSRRYCDPFTRFVFWPFYNLQKASHDQTNLDIDIDIINNDSVAADSAVDIWRQ